MVHTAPSMKKFLSGDNITDGIVKYTQMHYDVNELLESRRDIRRK